jgi:hypothetical protein
MNNQTNFARDMLVEIGKVVDQLDGEAQALTGTPGSVAADFVMDHTLFSVSSSIELSRIQNEWEALTAAEQATGGVTEGSQYGHRIDIETLSQEAGFTTSYNADALVVTDVAPTVIPVSGALADTDTKPIARDIAIASAANTLSTNINTLGYGPGADSNGWFKAAGSENLTLTMTAGDAKMEKAMTFTGANASLTVPMRTTAPATGEGIDDSGKMFFMNAADDNARTDFEAGFKFYFCENGEWFNSEFLLDDS